jgi:hypothetical protein
MQGLREVRVLIRNADCFPIGNRKSAIPAPPVQAVIAEILRKKRRISQVVL